ncbi:MAG: hypothetical protein ONB44_13125 [candidate division KSB1 bacterium]|nr:hypothetical protein [candidate division KSB1 bacterium]MDZ7303063.1 hypothetical protein [candidate division KSB1 bacterium]
MTTLIKGMMKNLFDGRFFIVAGCMARPAAGGQSLPLFGMSEVLP